MLPVLPMRTIALRRGDLFTHIAPGAGGYGDALLRDPDKVADDVADRRITRDAAQGVYGVVLTADGRPDADATAALRQAMAREDASPAAAQLQAFLTVDASWAPFADNVREGIKP